MEDRVLDKGQFVRVVGGIVRLDERAEYFYVFDERGTKEINRLISCGLF